MLSRRIKTLAPTEINRRTGLKFLTCSSCNYAKVKVAMDTINVICGGCVQSMVEPPPLPKEKSDKPRGWHLKLYYEHDDGLIYSKGTLVSDPLEIQELKHTAELNSQKKSMPKSNTRKRGRKHAHPSE